MKITDNFFLQEFVPKSIFSIFQERSVWFINPVMVAIAQKIRTDIGKSMTVNNWHVGGLYQYRGFRPYDCPVGAKYSQHRFGNAIDISIDGMEEYEVFEFLKKNYETYSSMGLTTIENPKFTKGWLHLDCRPKAVNYPLNSFLIVNP